MKTGQLSVRNVRLKDIAQKTGFTINTVSRALKNKNDISEATKRIVSQTADEMGYIGDSIASYMRTGTTKTLAVILGDISNLHFSIWIKQIEACALQFQYSTFVLNTDENPESEKRAILTALSKKVDGILLCPQQENLDNIRYLKESGVPFVLIGRRFPMEACSYCIIDDEKGGYLAARHLLAMGHRSILMINASPYISSAYERSGGYRRALESYGVAYDKRLELHIGAEQGACAKSLKKAIKSGPYFSAIFAFSDYIAFQAIYALNELGKPVPRDISIVGFDNIQAHALMSAPLDTITHVSETVPYKAVQILMDMIEKKDVENYRIHVIDVRLKKRGSVLPFKSAADQK